jgi:hypothetical protein
MTPGEQSQPLNPQAARPDNSLANLTQASSKLGLGYRQVTLLILNDSPTQLELDPESAQLRRGKWQQDLEQAGLPDAIAPGGSVLLRCQSKGVGRSIRGSVTCRLAGHAPHDSVRFAWRSRYFGRSTYTAQTSREGYTVDVDAGGGASAVVVFVFSKSVPFKLIKVCRRAWCGGLLDVCC